MNLAQTKAHLAAELVPKSAEHWTRLAFAAVVTGAGVFVVVVQVLAGTLGWIGPILILAGTGIMFTKTMISLAKALLPFKS